MNGTIHEYLDACRTSERRLKASPHRVYSISRDARQGNRLAQHRASSIASLLQFLVFVSDATQAKRYFVSGVVQGVGFRYFAQHAADKLGVNGFVRNLLDGRVEVLAIGTPQQLAQFRAMLERGPRFSSVTNVQEENASPDPHFEKGFSISNSV
jgi:acylphosphatase